MAVHTCDVAGTESPDPYATDHCWPCKMKYWRKRGTGTLVAYPYGQDEFHNTTIKESTDDMLKRARAHDIDPQPADPPVWT